MDCIDAELDRLPVKVGHCEGAKQPVEHRQTIAEIAVMMFGRNRMMDLMMRGAEDVFPPTWPECDP